MRIKFLAGVTLVTLVAFAACGGNDETGGSASTMDGGSNEASSSGSSGSSGSTSSSSSSSSSGGDPACSTLAQAGASIDVKGAKPPIPEATGGAPVDGTFVLTSVKAFSPLLQEGGTVQAFGAYTLVLGGGGTTFEQVVTSKDDEVSHAKGSLVVDGVSFTATPACEIPAADGGVTILSGKFTADATTLKMYVVRELGITAELLFEKK